MRESTFDYPACRMGPAVQLHGQRRQAAGRVAVRRSESGFTLVELMIAAAIIALLASIAYPTYVGQLRKSQRVEARTALMRGAQQLERSFTQNGGYPATAADFSTLYGLGASATVYSNPDQPSSQARSKFRLSYVPTANASGGLPVAFALQAVPLTSAIADADCATFVVNERGQRSVTGSDPQTNCWR